MVTNIPTPAPVADCIRIFDEEVVAAWAVLDSAGVAVSRRQVRRALLTAVRVRGQMAEIQASVGAAVVVPDEETSV